jgi:hypothetical protein
MSPKAQVSASQLATGGPAKGCDKCWLQAASSALTSTFDAVEASRTFGADAAGRSITGAGEEQQAALVGHTASG